MEIRLWLPEDEPIGSLSNEGVCSVCGGNGITRVFLQFELESNMINHAVIRLDAYDQVDVTLWTEIATD